MVLREALRQQRRPCNRVERHKSGANPFRQRRDIEFDPFPGIGYAATMDNEGENPHCLTQNATRQLLADDCSSATELARWLLLGERSALARRRAGMATDLSPQVSSSDGESRGDICGSVKQRGGVRSPRSSACSATLRSGSAAIGIFGGQQIAQRTVWADFVVVVLPCRQHGSGLGERVKQRLFEQFIAQLVRCSATPPASAGSSVSLQGK